MSRILLLNENIARGGVDTFIFDLISNWPSADDHFEVMINSNHPGLSGLKTKLSDKVVFRDYHGTFVWDFWGCRLASPRLAKIMRLIFQYPLFLIHFFKIARRLRKIDHDILFVVNGGYPGGDLCRAAILASRKPVIHNVHNLAGSIQRLRYPFEKLIDHCLGSKSRVETISVSKACAVALQKRLPGAFKFILNGVDLRGKAFAKSSHATLNCAIVGSLDPRKGQLKFLPAFALIAKRISNVRLLIFGEGDPAFKAELNAAAKKLGVEAEVLFMGFRTEKNEIFSEVDVLIVPSQEYESFGLVAIEAMIRQIPVVCSDVGGLPEVVVDGVSGFVVGKDNLDGFVEKTCLLLSDPSLREKMGQAGFAHVHQKFDVVRMCQDYHQVVSDLLARANGKVPTKTANESEATSSLS